MKVGMDVFPEALRTFSAETSLVWNVLEWLRTPTFNFRRLIKTFDYPEGNTFTTRH